MGFPENPSQFWGWIWPAAKILRTTNQTCWWKILFKKWWVFQKTRHNSNGKLQTNHSWTVFFAPQDWLRSSKPRKLWWVFWKTCHNLDINFDSWVWLVFYIFFLLIFVFEWFSMFQVVFALYFIIYSVCCGPKAFGLWPGDGHESGRVGLWLEENQFRSRSRWLATSLNCETWHRSH